MLCDKIFYSICELILCSLGLQLWLDSSRRSSITKISPGSKTIKELTERWESRSSLTSNEASPPSGKEWPQTPTNNKTTAFFLPSESEEWESFDPSTTPDSTNSNIPSNPVLPDRKFSVPLYSAPETGTVKLRDNKNKNAAPSRPSSLIGKFCNKFYAI